MIETLEKLVTSKSVFLLDTSIITSKYFSNRLITIQSKNPERLNIVYEMLEREREWLNEVKEIFQMPASIVVISEVVSELNEFIDYRKYNCMILNSFFDHLNRQDQRSHIAEYIQSLEEICSLAQARDPREDPNTCNIYPSIRTTSNQYRNALEHNVRQSMRIHEKKGNNLSQTDAFIATLAYILQKENYDVSIIARDTDFMSLLGRMRTKSKLYHLRDTQDSVKIFAAPDGYCIAYYNPDFSDGFYTPKEKIPVLDYPFQSRKDSSIFMLEREVWGNGSQVKTSRDYL